MLIIGIDPGLSGAICFFEDGEIKDIIDMPVMADGKKNKRQINGSQTYNEIYLRTKSIAKKEDITITNEALNLIVKASDGSVRDSLSILDQANVFKSQKEIQVEEIVNMLGFARQGDLYELSKCILDNNLSMLISMLDDMYQRG